LSALDDTESALQPAASATAIAEHVADVLRERIIRGELAPGARIVERTIAAELQLSRTPVREALKLLRADGLIEILRNSGARVTIYSPEEMLSLFDVISVLEGLAAERLAERISVEELDRLEEMHDAMMTFYKMRNGEDYFEINSAIHDAVIAGAGNPNLADAHRRMIARTRHGRFMTVTNPKRWQQSVEEHEALMDALRRRDARAAASVWRTHLLHTGDAAAELLRNAGV